METTATSRRKKGFWHRTLLAAGGIVLIILGLIGWILPILPGWPMMIAGVVMLGHVHPGIEAYILRFKRRLTAGGRRRKK